MKATEWSPSSRDYQTEIAKIDDEEGKSFNLEQLRYLIFSFGFKYNLKEFIYKWRDYKGVHSLDEMLQDLFNEIEKYGNIRSNHSSNEWF